MFFASGVWTRVIECYKRKKFVPSELLNQQTCCRRIRNVNRRLQKGPVPLRQRKKWWLQQGKVTLTTKITATRNIFTLIPVLLCSAGKAIPHFLKPDGKMGFVAAFSCRSSTKQLVCTCEFVLWLLVLSPSFLLRDRRQKSKRPQCYWHTREAPLVLTDE